MFAISALPLPVPECTRPHLWTRGWMRQDEEVLHDPTPSALPLALLVASLALASMAGVASASAHTTFTTSLTGAEEFPGPGDPNGKGFVSLDIYPNGTVCYTGKVQAIGRQITDAHIHVGAAGTAGPPVVFLDPLGANVTGSSGVALRRDGCRNCRSDHRGSGQLLRQRAHHGLPRWRRPRAAGGVTDHARNGRANRRGSPGSPWPPGAGRGGGSRRPPHGQALTWPVAKTARPPASYPLETVESQRRRAPGIGEGGRRASASTDRRSQLPEGGNGMRKLLFVVAAAGLLMIALAPVASGDNDHKFRASLNGYLEVPSIATAARGTFRAELRGDTRATA